MFSFMNDIYLKYALKSPCYYPALIKIVFQKLMRLMARKFRNNNFKPFNRKDFNTQERKAIALIAKEIKIPHISVDFIDSLPAFNLTIKEGAVDIHEIFVPLASKQVSLTDQFFDAKYNDSEDYYAANRFIWIYEVLAAYPYENVINYCCKKIIQWVDAYPEPSRDKRFESYSISERIIVFLFFLKFTRKHLTLSIIDREKIISSLTNQLLHLLKHLEYHGDKTNNHILNNARALYIAGRLLKNSEIEKLAKRILLNELPLVFDKGTYLEGSSHYQMLLTKNFLEMMLIAESTKDEEFIGLFQEPIHQMLVQSDILLGEYSANEYPLFGDISPDMAPDWFIGKPFSRKSGAVSKWASLFQHNSKLFSLETVEPQKYSITNKKASWLYIEKNGFEVWSTIKNGTKSGHGHNDNGSVVVFHKGQPIVIDPGLHTYNSKQKAPQVQCFSHNTPIIDNFTADIPLGSFISASPVFSRADLEKKTSSSIEYSIQYANRDININRQININDSACILTDTIYHSADYESFWVFVDKPIQLSHNTFALNNLIIEVSCTGSMQITIEKIQIRSLYYGHLTRAYRMQLKTRLENKSLIISFRTR